MLLVSQRVARTLLGAATCRAMAKPHSESRQSLAKTHSWQGIVYRDSAAAHPSILGAVLLA